MPRMKARVYVPTGAGKRRTKNFPIGRQKRAPGPVRLSVRLQADDEKVNLPTLIFERMYPRATWVVPAVKTPLYWFDTMMLNKKHLIIGIPPDTFIVDGRRFKVLAQDHHVIGVGYTRWLVYEQAAVPKGQKP